MNPDPSKFDEVRCPDCNEQLVMSAVKGEQNTYRFEGCRCGRKDFVLPDMVSNFTVGGPMFLYKKISN